MYPKPKKIQSIQLVKRKKIDPAANLLKNELKGIRTNLTRNDSQDRLGSVKVKLSFPMCDRNMHLKNTSQQLRLTKSVSYQ